MGQINMFQLSVLMGFPHHLLSKELDCYLAYDIINLCENFYNRNVLGMK